MLYTVQSNQSIYASGIKYQKSIFLAILVPNPCFKEFISNLKFELLSSQASRKELNSPFNIVKIKISPRQLVSSVSIHLDILSNHVHINFIKLLNIPNGLSIPLFEITSKNYNKSQPAISTIISTDYHLLPDYLEHHYKQGYGNFFIFVDIRKSLPAYLAAQKAQDKYDFNINLIPMIGPYYGLCSITTSDYGDYPADSGILEAQKDYFFILAPIYCMLSELISVHLDFPYLAFADLDERQYLNIKSIFNMLASTNKSISIEEICVYTRSTQATSISSIKQQDLLFPYGRYSRNKKIIVNLRQAKDIDLALDSAHGFLNTSYQQLISSNLCSYTHFFNITSYKRHNLNDCLKKINKRINYFGADLNPSILSEHSIKSLNPILDNPHKP